MKKILFLGLIILMFSCEEKQAKTIVAQQNQTIPTKESIKIREEEKSNGDSIKAPKPQVIIPVKIPETPDKIIKCFPPESVDYKDKGGNMENGFVTECLYKNHTLEKAYNKFREMNIANDDGKFLEKKMPSGKHTASFNDYPISVTYTYPQKHILEVEILFPGGVTIIHFKKEKDDVRVNVNHSPD
ncbi:hypothetical protein [Chryseobacterium sp. FH1]|uniref:hypothetical protein n=1 Tax=Chryseobacterium sp. FH1 TaxID=1233951 RepID=UPI0004E3F612|nr:hypothetical protein [Chryseobacterium sp. FH1]KFC19449.1 hypothetical protein IO90_09135 [Chryseobacterium sp. FH1]